MNIINFPLKGFSAKFFAAVTIVSLLMSAFPVAFFVAHAADVFTDSFEVPTLLGNWTEEGWSSSNDAKSGGKSAKLVGANNTQTMSKNISTVGYESPQVSFWYKAKGLEWDNGNGGYDKVEVQYTTDGSTWTTFYTIDGDDSNGVQDDEQWHEVVPPANSFPAAAKDNADFGLRFKGDLSSGNDTVWIDDVTTAGTAIQQPVDVCPNIDGDQAEIPDGYELDNAGDCVEIEEPPVDFCDPTEKPGGMSIAQWHDANDFDGSSCFDYEVTQQCGSLDVQFTANETGLSYEFRYAIGDETPANWEGDGVLPVYFDEDENGGSVDVTYYVVGAEKDYFVGSDVPNFWDGNGETVTVDTDCKEPEPVVMCTLELVSDTTDYVVEKDANAQELSFIHSAWTAIINGALWIWGDDPVADPANEETQTFTKKFGWVGGVSSATLYVASDNSHRAELNNILVGEAADEQNFRVTDQDEYDVSSAVAQGNNELSIEVTNWAGNSNPASNPAGLLYKLVIETTDDVDCDIPWEEPTPDPTLEITNPATDGQTLAGEHTFEAEYLDDDETVDHINWAIRYGTCAANSGTVAGNVDGFNDAWSFVDTTFSTTIDMTGWDAGEYCFVVNPKEGPGEDDLRETRTFIIEEPEVMAPYCGDGEINQEWEQCDGEDKGDSDSCTDYCTYGNQCTDLKLVKITLDEQAPVSVSFDGTIHLGTAGNLVPSGMWFLFEDGGDDAANTIANADDMEGLAVSRVGGELTLAAKGDNARNKFDYVFGSIETLGIDLGAVDRSPITGWPLEDGGSYPDIFDVDGDEESVEFKMWLTTGDDAVSVEINAGEEYDCPECMAVAEARIILDDSGYAGEGQDNDDILLGDGTRVDYGEWFPVTALDNSGDYIADAENATNFTDANTTSGLFVSRNGDGTINVTLVGNHRPGGNTNHEYVIGTLEVRDIEIASAAEIPGDFKLENHSEADSVPSNDGYDILNVASVTEVEFGMWVDTASDGFKVTLDDETLDYCEDDDEDRDDEDDTFIIDGYKYEQGEDYIDFLPGWTIFAENTNEAITLSTTTDENGYFWFEVEDEGYWEITEEVKEDWEQVAVYQNGELVNHEGEGNEYCDFEVYVDNDEDSYQCDFYNQQLVDEDEDGDDNYEEDEGDGESTTGTRISRGSGRVLGAATSQCGMYLFDYMKEGQINDSLEVLKLQAFLTGQGYWTPMTGVFDHTTDQMVRAFQAEHAEDVLMPWFEAGYVNHTNPTGWVYQLTRWKINNIVCPGSEPLPTLIP